jgi:glycine/D-amino acid oxidase-like deaminating enzyme
LKTFETDHVIVGAGIAGVWLARRLLSIGRSVAMVEIGPRDRDGAPPPRPSLRFPERANIGASQARNHVLTGNSSFWGGGLIRNDEQSLRGMFDLDEHAEALDDFARAYDAIQRELKTPSIGRSPVTGTEQPGRISDVLVLPGKKRNLARTILEACAEDPRLTLFCSAEVADIDFGPDRQVKALTVRLEDGSHILLAADHYVLAMGVIDTNLFAMTKLRTLVHGSSARIGTRLHDHWSIPIATIRWKRGAGLEWLYPPTFRGEFIQGRRVEIDADLPGDVRAGFLHVQAPYDLVEPYATIKKWLNARQQGRGWTEQARYLWPLSRNALRLARIGYSRYVEGRLFVSDGMPLSVVLDFESCSSEHNRLAFENGEYRLYWDVRDEDATAFASLFARGVGMLKHWTSRYDLELDVLPTRDDVSSLSDYLRIHAVDAYHLGGGLAAGRDPERGIVDPRLRFHGIRNLALLSTSAFARPGIANPVATLLAMGERYAGTV